MDPLGRLTDVLAGATGIAPDTVGRLLGTALVFLFYLAVRRVVRRVVTRTLDEPSMRYQVTRAVTYAAGGLAIVALSKIWIVGLTGYATYLGLLSAGVAIALQDPLTNLAGWAFILSRRPFSVGDRIQIGPHAGDVVDIRVFRFVMLEIGNWVHADQSTGRIVHVPNGLVFKNPTFNYDQAFGYIWNELEVCVTFESDWRAAKEALGRTVAAHAAEITPEEAAKISDAAEHFHIKFGKTTPIVWTSVTNDGVKLTLRYLCKPRERRVTASCIWEAVLDELAKLDDVDLAYTTTRMFDHVREGKPKLRAPEAEEA